jgi:hypothetical protein
MMQNKIRQYGGRRDLALWRPSIYYPPVAFLRYYNDSLRVM